MLSDLLSRQATYMYMYVAYDSVVWDWPLQWIVCEFTVAISRYTDFDFPNIIISSYALVK